MMSGGQVHSQTKLTEYSGEVVELAECLSRLPAGGQCLISGTSFHSVLGRLQASSSAPERFLFKHL